MGCTNSKLEKDEGVARCRARKRFMKHAVSSRQALASAHAQYFVALRGSGAAFRQFGEGERQEVLSASSTGPNHFLAIADVLPPPPPPLYPTTPISPPRLVQGSQADSLQSQSPPASQRSVSRSPEASHNSREDDWPLYNPPPHSRSSNVPAPPPPPRSGWHNLFVDPFRPVPECVFSPSSPPPLPFGEQRNGEAENESRMYKEEEVEEGMPQLEDPEPEANGVHEVKINIETVQDTLSSEELPVIEAQDAIMQRSTDMTLLETPPRNEEYSVVVSLKQRTLLEVLTEVDDLFLKASRSGDSICRLLETKKVHYHSSFSEVKGMEEQSPKPFSSTSWLRSLSLSRSSSFSTSSLSQRDWTVDSVVGNGEIIPSHMSTLDRLLAWETKLYAEVKAAEGIRIDLERKCALLRNQDTKGDDPLAIDKTRASIKVLHTQFMVALEAVDAASNAINKLRDEEMFSRLVELLEGMRDMWKGMYEAHRVQHKIVKEMKVVDESPAVEPTTSLHRQSTQQLAIALARWAVGFSNVISTQREYFNNLNGWLRLSLIQPDSELRIDQSKREDRSTKVGTRPIYSLCQDWQRVLDDLPDKVFLASINDFVNVVNEWVRLQSDELKLKKKSESLEHDLHKKEHLLEISEKRYLSSAPSGEEYEPDNSSPRRASLNESKGRVDQFRLKVEQEKEKVEKSIHATRAKTVNSIQHSLPGVFNAISIFASVAYQSYSNLFLAHGVRCKVPRLTG